MFPVGDDCDECTAPLYDRSFGAQPLSAVALSSIPFLFTFVAISAAAFYKLLPLLADQQYPKSNSGFYLPFSAPPSLRSSQDDYESKTLSRRIVAISFSTTFGLATVLAELILCEISNTLNPAARKIGLHITVPTLLVFLVVLIPFLELQSIIRGAGWEFKRAGKGRILKLPWLLQALGFMVWLTCFWWLGKALPGAHLREPETQHVKNLSNACLERIGIIGISLMALLSGFASVSSPWHLFGARPRPVTDSDIARKKTGLDSTNDMLNAKKSRLRVLQRKISENSQQGFMSKVVGTIRGNTEVQEAKVLQMEISGLETMATCLSSSLTILQNRKASSERAATPLGKAMIIPNYTFSVYCIYRIFATTITSLRRWSRSGATFSNSDPINRFLGLLAKHWDPTLDQAGWSRQISFLLSGVILFASFNSVLQTFHLFARWMPGLLYQAQANLALIVAQISAIYVISSALLLRSNMPREVGSVISEALGTPMDGLFVEKWFEGWFLFGGLATAFGIWAGKHFLASDYGAADDWDDYGGDMEMGHKRS